MQNPQYQNVQPQPQQFISPGGQTSMDMYSQPSAPQYVQYQPAPMSIPTSGTTSQVYPVDIEPMMKQIVYDQGIYSETAEGQPLIQNNPTIVNTNSYYPGDNDGATSMILCCCGCGIILILVSLIVGTIAGSFTGGFGLLLYLLAPVGACMMCCGCLACFTVDHNKDISEI